MTEQTTETQTQETTQEAPTTNIEETIMSGAEGTEKVEQEAQSESSLFEETESAMDAENRPEWLPEKFKTGEDLSNSYKELEKKLGAHAGAPEEYAMEVGEGLDDYAITTDDPFAADFANLLKESGVNQDTYNKIANLYFSKMKTDSESIEYAQDEQFKQDCKELGDAGLQEVKDSIHWAKDILPEETFNMLREVGNKDLTIGKMIKSFYDSYEGKNYIEMPTDSDKILSNIDRKTEAMGMMKDERYGKDKHWTQATDQRYKELYG